MGNVLVGNGFFGNPSNGDLANAAVPFHLDNCFVGNIDLKSGKPSSSPANLQDPSVAGVCGRRWNTATVAGSDEFTLTAELGCASLGGSVPGICAGLPPPLYPVQDPTKVRMVAIPHEEGMENPCDAVPANSWCP